MEENQVSIDYNWLGKMYRLQATPQFHMKLQNDYVYANECFAKIASDHVDDSVVSDVPLNVEMGENINQEEEPTNSEKDTAGDSVYGDENSQDFVNADEDTTINAWTIPATKLLLEEYKKRIKRFRSPKIKKITLWREIEVILKGKKLSFDTTTIQAKFRNMKHTYGKIKKNNSRKTTGAGRLTWPYFNEMEEIFRDDKSINFSSDEVISSMVDVENSPMNDLCSNDSSMSSTKNTPDDCAIQGTSTGSSTDSGRPKQNKLYYQRQRQLDVDTLKLDILKDLGEKIDQARKVRESNALLVAQRTSEQTDAINARTEVLKDISNHLKVLLERTTKSNF